MGSFVRHHTVTMTSNQYIPQRQSTLHVLPLLFSYVLQMYDISARHTGYHTNCTYLIKSEVFEHAPTYTFVHIWFKDFCRTRVKLLNILSSLEHVSTYNRHKRVSVYPNTKKHQSDLTVTSKWRIRTSNHHDRIFSFIRDNNPDTVTKVGGLVSFLQKSGNFWSTHTDWKMVWGSEFEAMLSVTWRSRGQHSGNRWTARTTVIETRSSQIIYTF
jgi:hypothetical protein